MPICFHKGELCSVNATKVPKLIRLETRLLRGFCLSAYNYAYQLPPLSCHLPVVELLLVCRKLFRGCIGFFPIDSPLEDYRLTF